MLFKSFEKVNLMDGVRVTLPDNSWVLIRPSGTEPVIRVTIEAKTKKKRRRYIDVAKLSSKKPQEVKKTEAEQPGETDTERTSDLDELLKEEGLEESEE